MRIRFVFTFTFIVGVAAGCTHVTNGNPHDMSVGGASDMTSTGGGTVDEGGLDFALAPGCGDGGGKCTTSTGGLGLCNSGSGICACGGASADDDCNAAYGDGSTSYVCDDGACVPGTCSTSAACTQGEQCVADDCVPCSGSGASDTCKSDPVYGNAYQCVNGACTAGNCRHDSDCTPNAGSINTQLCVANVCTACTSDQQCQADGDTTGSGGATSLCATAMSGVCVANVTCIVTGSGIAAEEAACAGYNNGDDICCGGKCVSGVADPMNELNCCTADVTNDCAAQHLQCMATGTAGGGVCSTCNTVMPDGNGTTTYVVDPTNGDDTKGTGDATTGCAFKTIHRALQVAGAPTAAVVIAIADNNAALDAGETYPISVPANVTITTHHQGGAGDVTVHVPAMQGMTAVTTAFVFNGKNSGLANFTLDGGGMVATGVQVTGYAPTAGAPVTLSDVSLGNFKSQAVLVSQPAALPANPQLLVTGGQHGTHLDGNGSDTVAASGMTVAGYASVQSTDTGKPVTFSGNGFAGINVVRTGQLALVGTSGGGAPSSNTAVVCANDRAAGINIAQTGSMSGLPTSTIKGVTLTAAGTGPSGVTFTIMQASGLHVTGGSQMQLRNSLVYGNAKGSAVRIDDYKGPSNVVVSTVGGIDLGTGTSGAAAGNNVLQGNGGSLANNAGAGVCLAVAATAAQKLSAEGNRWSSGVDCTSSTATLTTNGTCTTGSVDVVVTPKAGSTNSVDVTMCK